MLYSVLTAILSLDGAPDSHTASGEDRVHPLQAFDIQRRQARELPHWKVTTNYYHTSYSKANPVLRSEKVLLILHSTDFFSPAFVIFSSLLCKNYIKSFSSQSE